MVIIIEWKRIEVHVTKRIKQVGRVLITCLDLEAWRWLLEIGILISCFYRRPSSFYWINDGFFYMILGGQMICIGWCSFSFVISYVWYLSFRICSLLSWNPEIQPWNYNCPMPSYLLIYMSARMWIMPTVACLLKLNLSGKRIGALKQYILLTEGAPISIH